MSSGAMISLDADLVREIGRTSFDGSRGVAYQRTAATFLGDRHTRKARLGTQHYAAARSSGDG